MRTFLDELKVKIFADGADKEGMLEMYANSHIKGFTTNSTLMRKAGISDYRHFALDIIHTIPDRPISFQLLSDDFDEMGRQAREISSWGDNVYVKIPVMNTKGEASLELVKNLAGDGVKQNVTALMTKAQAREVADALAGGTLSYISVFAGRIADTGRDPVPIMTEIVEMISPHKNIELIWASPREVLNIFQADAIGCHVITVTNDLLNKLNLFKKDLHELSLDTVKMFYKDAVEAGYHL